MAHASFYRTAATKAWNQNQLLLRKLSAILLTCIFACSQYARHLSYLECKILNTLKPASRQCDCEKLVIAKNTGPSPASPANHLHLHLEEFFDKPADIFIQACAADLIAINFYYPGNESDGCSSSPWQPPDC